MARCRNNYVVPMNGEDIEEVIRKHSPAHFGSLRHSVDFACEEGDPIYAAASGEVVWLRNDSNVGGPNKKYWLKGNRIVIKHKNDEYTAYEHLKYRGAVVRVGEKVKQRQLIGYSGNTGYSLGPHLHFEVFNNPSRDLSEGETLQVFFRELLRGK